jgi:hypothetical protein
MDGRGNPEDRKEAFQKQKSLQFKLEGYFFQVGPSENGERPESKNR